MDNHVGMHASTIKDKVKGRDANQNGYFERAVISNNYFKGALTSKT
jgi:hypothetical protein